jgi:cytochrome c oxidase assembly factor CtaG
MTLDPKHPCVIQASAIAAAPAHAHVSFEGEAGSFSALSGWDPLGLALILLLGGVYLAGQLRLRRTTAARTPRTRRALLFWTAWGALALALSPPVESFTGASFAVHMVQHEVLMLVAAPLLVLARPQGVLIWGLPEKLRRGAARLAAVRPLRRVAAWSTDMLTAWVLHAVVLWGWHVPVAFQATLTSDPLHWLQHTSFFLVAVLFWSSVAGPAPQSARAAIAFLSIFTTAVHTSVLGALLTFSSTPWYPAYRDGGLAALTALEDQQLGGLIMWVPGGFVFLAAGLALAARALAASGRRSAA